jgi:hypothetical protein
MQAFATSSYSGMPPLVSGGMYGSMAMGMGMGAGAGMGMGAATASQQSHSQSQPMMPGALQKRFVSVFLPALACVAVAGSRFYVYLTQVISGTMVRPRQRSFPAALAAFLFWFWLFCLFG